MDDNNKKEIEKHQRAFERQQIGRAAQLLFDQMAPIIDEERKKSLVRIKGLYRGGKATESNLLAGVAELCTLDDLEHSFRVKIQLGLKAGKDLHE